MYNVRKLLKKLKGFISTQLPTGKAAFDDWANSFFDIYDLPTSDKDSVVFALASTTLNLGPQVSHKPKYYFYKTIISGAAKQVAGNAFYEIKMRQKEAAAALAAKENENK